MMYDVWRQRVWCMMYGVSEYVWYGVSEYVWYGVWYGCRCRVYGARCTANPTFLSHTLRNDNPSNKHSRQFCRQKTAKLPQFLTDEFAGIKFERMCIRYQHHQAILLVTTTPGKPTPFTHLPYSRPSHPTSIHLSTLHISS
jgi:hypothetical protein